MRKPGAFFRQVARDGNLANEGAAEGANRRFATVAAKSAAAG